MEPGLYFRCWDGPNRRTLNHKLHAGRVESSFERHSKQDLMSLGVTWPDNVRAITTGQYGSLGIDVTIIDVTKPLETQAGAVDEAFRAMQTLVPFAALHERLSSSSGSTATSMAKASGGKR